jgi:hypothetical protein
MSRCTLIFFIEFLEILKNDFGPVGASTSRHSFKNQTGSLVEPEKTGTDDLSGLFSAQDRSRH